MKSPIEALRLLLNKNFAYAVRRARGQDDLRRAQALRFAIFNMGAMICGPPALDRHFKTIDFLTWLDLQAVPAVVRNRYSS